MKQPICQKCNLTACMLGSCVTNFKGIGSAVLQKKFRELLRTQSTVEPQQLILYRPPAS